MLYTLPIIAFLLGSIPFGLIIAKAHGVDIREKGSGNIGATNVLRTLGKRAGYSCLFLDFLKGLLPVLLATNIIRWEGGGDPQFHLTFLDSSRIMTEQFTAQLIHVITAICAVLGHNYSPWIGFKGGKGIATSGGVLFALMPAAVGLILLIWIATFFLTRYVSVASIAAAASLPVLTHLGSRFHGKWADGTWNKPLFFLSLLLGILAIWKHRSNIKKLIKGTENRFESKKKQKASQ